MDNVLGSFILYNEIQVQSPTRKRTSDAVLEPIHSATRPRLDALAATTTKDLDDVTDPPREPVWYKQTKVANTRGPRSGAANYSSAIDLKLSALRAAISYCEDTASRGRGQALDEADLAKVATGLHEAFFIEFGKEVAAKAAIRKNRMLHNDGGLPRLFHDAWLQSHKITYPLYIIADAKELYTKWWRGIFDTSLYRGIAIGKKKNTKIDRAGSANRLEPGYEGRLDGKFFGNKHLLNGQWWPHQLCALRDGAHNSAQAGIAGDREEGAWSVILGGDPRYPDIDNDDEVQYCGTAAAEDATEPTTATQYMKRSVEVGHPVRVIRSENCKNAELRPKKGYRYDGLYKVVDEELIDIKKQLWRFKMQRLPGQDPIRATGAGERPTQQELDKLQLSKVERAFLA